MLLKLNRDHEASSKDRDDLPLGLQDYDTLMSGLDEGIGGGED